MVFSIIMSLSFCFSVHCSANVQGMLEIRSYRSFVSRYYSAPSGYDGHNHHHHHRNGDHMKSKARVEQEKITGGEYYHDEHPKNLGVPALVCIFLHSILFVLLKHITFSKVKNSCDYLYKLI